MTVEDAASLARWIKTQLHLGRLSEEGIQTVLKFVCRIGIDTNDEQMICSLVGSIFEGLRSSSVFRLQDLQTKTISKLFDAITCGLFTRRSQDLGFQIIEQLKLSNTYIDKKTVSSFIIRSFYAQASQQELEKQESRFLDTIPRTIEMLRGFHELGAISIVDITSRSLINGESHLPVSNNARLKILAFWWSALAKSRVQSSQGTTRTDLVGKEVERLMSVQKLEVVVPYLVHLADIRKARFILEYWLGLDMSDGHLVKAFDTLCRSQDECDPFLAMFRVVGDFTTWEQAKIGRIFRVLQMLQKPETIVTIIKDSNIAKTMIDESTVLRTIRTYARPNPMLAERIFSFSRKLTLERCPELAERIILHQTFHPNTALHYFRTRSPLVNVVRNRQRTVRLRAHLLQRMALAYSSARHLSPRISFRKVYDCYRCHKSERLGPLGVGMTQALARAGIIRPLRAGQWVSTQKLRWILSVIRHVESADVADRADAMVYKWRGVNIRNIQMRLQREKGARGQWTNVPPKIRIRNKWSRYWRRYERIMTL